MRPWIGWPVGCLRKVSGLIIVMGFLLGAAPGGANSAAAQVRVGDLFPGVATGQGGDAAAVALAGVKGRVALIDFWASWCAPCKASFPAYGRIYADYGPKGLGLLAVSVDEKAGDYAGFVRRLAPPFAVVRDANQSLVQRVEVPTMPTSYLLDRAGRVRYLHAGFHGAATEAALRKEIETLLAERAS